MMQTRGRSAYVTLNVVWLLGLCFAVFLAGMAFQSFGDSKTETTCPVCEEAGGEHGQVYHGECLERLIAEQVQDQVRFPRPPTNRDESIIGTRLNADGTLKNANSRAGDG